MTYNELCELINHHLYIMYICIYVNIYKCMYTDV